MTVQTKQSVTIKDDSGDALVLRPRDEYDDASEPWEFVSQQCANGEDRVVIYATESDLLDFADAIRAAVGVTG